MIERGVTEIAQSRLFKPLKVGPLELKNRLVMAPLTRLRADEHHVPLPFVVDYYRQRASTPGTLLITEATVVSQKAGGYANVPGISSQEQIAAWRKVTDAVHAQGSHIFLQLWALGRVANPAILKAEGNNDLIGASPIASGPSKSTPRELTTSEIRSFVDDFAQAARNAVHRAGFDGVEIHGANGYLLDQFLEDVSNQRRDAYGGSIENRSRFTLEVASAVAAAVGPERVGMRLSPYSTFQSMGMADPIPQFSHAIAGLAKLDLAYVHVVEARVAGSSDITDNRSLRWAVDAWQANLAPASRGPGAGHPVFLAGGYTPANAVTAVDNDYPQHDVAVVFGRYFISTPDLVYRVKNGLDMNRYHRDTFYKAMSKDGYVDYPFSEEFRKEHPILMASI